MTQPKQFNNAMEIFKLLPQTNCMDCHCKTCLAFAGAVFTGGRKLLECPHLPPDVRQKYGESVTGQPENYKNVKKAMARLKEKVKQIDLARISDALGGKYENNRLTIKVLGKHYSVDDHGEIHTDIHVIPWVSLPVYNYILGRGNGRITGNWVPLRELPSGQDWYRLFGQRCEKPLKSLADKYPELFGDMVRLFSGQQSDPYYDSDVSVILHPLPKIPMLICYWAPEDELSSQLSLFFDESAEDFIDLNSINSLGSGFVTMLEKLTLRHA